MSQLILKLSGVLFLITWIVNSEYTLHISTKCATYIFQQTFQKTSFKWSTSQWMNVELGIYRVHWSSPRRYKTLTITHCDARARLIMPMRSPREFRTISLLGSLFKWRKSTWRCVLPVAHHHQFIIIVIIGHTHVLSVHCAVNAYFSTHYSLGHYH